MIKFEKIIKISSYFACSKFRKFANISSEMKKILTFVIAIAMGIGVVNAAVRDGNSASRGSGNTTVSGQKRISTTEKNNRTLSPRTIMLGVNSSRTATTNGRNTNARAASTQVQKNVVARATSNDTTSTTETRTGAEYEKCKNSYFTCMDQFCALKNDDYRRCSCSDRVDVLASARESLIETGNQITIFNENLDTVGMTAAQAKSLHTATDGENALTSDTSASKALLQAIMNSIRGGDTTVGGKYANLNSIDMSFDSSTAFGTSDNGQIIASYNGQNLYSAVYPQCRNAVRDDCNNASLQRAITAYLMAIEQDCNTVQTAIEQKQKELKYAVRESSAMLDLARVENRQKHNSDDMTTCINNVEAAILSEEVCGANYHKCLDNGEFIDISTGAPITGVADFYKLGQLLSFDAGDGAANQKLSKISRNKSFVVGFEKRTKKFAEPALDKCVEIADTVWEEYLDKAMLSIYYAQQSKVSEIKSGCFDFISQCYESTDRSITTAMSKLLTDNAILLQPSKIKLGAELCTNYVDSCKHMFDNEQGTGSIIEQYVNARKDEDLLSACRAVVKQCFDKYGGSGYENFYYPYSGLFINGKAQDWFTLYSYNSGETDPELTSPCAKQLFDDVPACSYKDDYNEQKITFFIQIFGGFDMHGVDCSETDGNNCKAIQEGDEYNTNDSNIFQQYGIVVNGTNGTKYLKNRGLRSVGVATEIYNQIIDTLSTQCRNLNGRFIEMQFLQKSNTYNTSPDNPNFCRWAHHSEQLYSDLEQDYGIAAGEDMCPRDYSLAVDTQSWGICSCWENGGRRSKHGTSATCVAALPSGILKPDATSCDWDITHNGENATCTAPDSRACEKMTENDNKVPVLFQPTSDSSGLAITNLTSARWCTRNKTDNKDRVCPYLFDQSQGAECKDNQNQSPGAYFNALVPEGNNYNVKMGY